MRLPSRYGLAGTARQGFTLIELLVVVAVIAVLLAILMPALSYCRVTARRIVCGGRLRQINVAWQCYLDDNEGRFYQGVNANLNYGGWRGIRNWTPRPLNRYANIPADPCQVQARPFLCPADRGGVPGDLYEKAFVVNGTSYQTNIFLVGQDKCGAFSQQTAKLDQQISLRLPGIGITKVSNPAVVILIGDFGWVNQWMPRDLPVAEWKSIAEWHGRVDCHNVGFVDGHVQFLRVRKGVYISHEYAVLPFKDLYGHAQEVQWEDR